MLIQCCGQRKAHYLACAPCRRQANPAVPLQARTHGIERYMDAITIAVEIHPVGFYSAARVQFSGR